MHDRNNRIIYDEQNRIVFKSLTHFVQTYINEQSLILEIRKVKNELDNQKITFLTDNPRFKRNPFIENPELFSFDYDLCGSIQGEVQADDTLMPNKSLKISINNDGWVYTVWTNNYCIIMPDHIRLRYVKKGDTITI